MGLTPDRRGISQSLGRQVSKIQGCSHLNNGGRDSHEAEKKEIHEPSASSFSPMALFSPITHTTDQGDTATV